ncbi:Hypothetical protein R9X50_00269900 [Acrodontium crateriforme]|uniref:PWI domain-containing protein n=1 Tax=Acrodontium crateriforme TaxID=150365 RepID=A0AAQ3R992_9PEZI|nr:Hypothetical protein R9X50_00269900 [Acrodontium crateriforme]
MAYNYGPPPGAYGGAQPPYAPPGANPPGLPMAAPGFGAPPGMEAPPGMMPASSINNMQPPFQPPPNMPNINFNAPVIRLGVADQQRGSPADRSAGGGRDGRGNADSMGGGRGRPGVGADRSGGDRNLDRERAALRESIMALQPPTREEVARTIFIGGLGEGTPSDDALESILRCAGKLRRWIRARDADDNPCKFGFAEYEDVESLEAANEILVNVQVPLLKNGRLIKDEDGEAKKAALLVVVDEQSKSYIEEWKGKRNEDDNARQFRIDGCKEDLRQCLTALANQAPFADDHDLNGHNGGDDTIMADGSNGDAGNAEVITIPLGVDDELSDIPADMRATVAEEIKAFRDRSNRRDVERLRREEELETAERERNNRFASPPPSNGAPSGTQSSIQGAPTGPKGYRGAQLPSDYANGVSFVDSNGINHEDEDAEESDEELERRRQAAKIAEQDQLYETLERRRENRERTRAAAHERERTREEAAEKDAERAKEEAARVLREYDDDEEARLARHEYYKDHSAWLRKRAQFREREERDDERDRIAEEREKAEEKRQTADAKGAADDFLNQTADELASRTQEQSAPSTTNAFGGGVKISLGSAAARSRAQPNAAPRRAMADVEGLLEDEEDAAASGLKRPSLKPLTDTSTLPTDGQDLSDDERAAARQQLAAEIPTASDALFAYPIQWPHVLDPAVLDQQIKPFVEKKVLEYLGVQEDLLVEAVVDGIREKKAATEIIAELEPALEEESEVLVRKVWRLMVFWGESASRGLM